jgi:HemY protein
MIRATVILLVLAALAAGIAWFADHPGAVSIAWQGWRIDTSVGVLAAAVLLVAAIAALAYRLWRALRAAPGSLRRHWREGRRLKGYRALTHGMVAVAAGDAEEARRQARRADVLLNEPPLTMLLSAQAAQLNGDDEAAERYFTAMLARKETEFLGLRGLVMQATRKGDTERALALARRARALQPRTGWVLSTLHDLEARAGAWPEAAETARLAGRAGTMTSEESRRNRAIAAYEQSLAAEATGERKAALARARQAASLDPSLVPAVIRAANLLDAAGRRRRARRLIEAGWAAAPHRELARAYLALDGEAAPLARLMQVQRLVARRPEHPEARIAIAEAALAAQLWGEARRALEALGRDESSPAFTAGACRLWASLEEAEHGDAAAGHDWLARAAAARPDPAWVCKQCGAAHTHWTPLCQRCAAYDALAWRSPAHALPPELAPPPPSATPGPGEPAAPPRPAEAATELGNAG